MYLGLRSIWVNFCERHKMPIWLFFILFSSVLPMDVQLFQHPLLFFWNCHYSIVKDQLTIFWWVYFWALCYIDLFVHSFTIPHCCEYHSFMVNLEVVSVSLLTLFFFGIVLAVLALLPFHINPRLSLLISTK